MRQQRVATKQDIPATLGVRTAKLRLQMVRLSLQRATTLMQITSGKATERSTITPAVVEQSLIIPTTLAVLLLVRFRQTVPFVELLMVN